MSSYLVNPASKLSLKSALFEPPSQTQFQPLYVQPTLPFPSLPASTSSCWILKAHSVTRASHQSLCGLAFRSKPGRDKAFSWSSAPPPPPLSPTPSPRTGLRDAVPRFSLPSLASVPLPLPLVTLFSTSRRVRSLEIHFCARQCERGSCASVLHGLRGSGDQYPDSVKKASCWCQYPLVPLRSSAHDCYLKVHH